MVKKILVVDVERETRDLLLDSMRTAGYEAIGAANRDEALRLIATE